MSQDLLQAAITSLESQIDACDVENFGKSIDYLPKRVQPLPMLTAVKALLQAASASLGECRETTPYSPLRPVLSNGKLRWCCNHDPEHCST